MRPETRLILGWLIGRPPGWHVYVQNVQWKLGLTPKRWARARKEMQAAGYLVQKRERDKKGKYVWSHVISDQPIFGRTSIPPKSTDGYASNGKSRNENPQDKTTQTQHSKYKQSNNNSFAVSLACVYEARRLFPGYDISGLERQWLAWVSTLAEKPRYPDRAFIGWLRKNCARNPLAQSDRTRFGLGEDLE